MLEVLSFTRKISGCQCLVYMTSERKTHQTYGERYRITYVFRIDDCICCKLIIQKSIISCTVYLLRFESEILLSLWPGDNNFL